MSLPSLSVTVTSTALMNNAEEMHSVNFKHTDLCKRALTFITEVPNEDLIFAYLGELQHTSKMSLLFEIAINDEFWLKGIMSPIFMVYCLAETLGDNAFNGNSSIIRRVLSWQNVTNSASIEWIQYIHNKGFTCSSLNKCQVNKLQKNVNNLMDFSPEGSLRRECIITKLTTELAAREIILNNNYNMDKLINEIQQIENNNSDDITIKDDQIYKLISQLKISELPQLVRKLLYKINI